jgi:F-box interacting protein
MTKGVLILLVPAMDYSVWPVSLILRFTFGCDTSTGTYKVIVSCYIRDQLTSKVRVLSFGDNVWRNIKSFPVVPLALSYRKLLNYEYDGVFFDGNFNWLAIHGNIEYSWLNVQDFTADQFVIVSLYLETETYSQYLLPQGFDKVTPAEPELGVLGDCLCFSYSYKETDFIIWQMKKFGVEESWTQFLKISYHDLQLDYDFSIYTLKYHLQFLPLFLSKDGDTLILYSSEEREAIIYNWKDRRVEQTGVTVDKTIIYNGTNSYLSWDLSKGYVESLVSIC